MVLTVIRSEAVHLGIGWEIAVVATFGEQTLLLPCCQGSQLILAYLYHIHLFFLSLTFFNNADETLTPQSLSSSLCRVSSYVKSFENNPTLVM